MVTKKGYRMQCLYTLRYRNKLSKISLVEYGWKAKQYRVIVPYTKRIFLVDCTPEYYGLGVKP